MIAIIRCLILIVFLFPHQSNKHMGLTLHVSICERYANKVGGQIESNLITPKMECFWYIYIHIYIYSKWIKETHVFVELDMFKTNRLAVGIHSSLNPHPWRQLTPGNENLQGTGTFLGHWLRWDTFPEKRWSEIFRTQRQETSQILLGMVWVCQIYPNLYEFFPSVDFIVSETMPWKLSPSHHHFYRWYTLTIPSHGWFII